MGSGQGAITQGTFNSKISCIGEDLAKVGLLILLLVILVEQSVALMGCLVMQFFCLLMVCVLATL